ncbi:MAG: adenylosuccinate synthetase [Chromatiales bacterium]|nr:adenylosuccinate synthetase [Chromatiales bacterium]
MPVTVLVGCQWGDEGKGKVADLLSRRMDWVARSCWRAQRGAHRLPGAGEVRPPPHPLRDPPESPRCVIGHGTVLDPLYLVQEMEAPRPARDQAQESSLRVGRGAPGPPVSPLAGVARGTGQPDRHHPARDRAGVPGQGRSRRHPDGGADRPGRVSGPVGGTGGADPGAVPLRRGRSSRAAGGCAAGVAAGPPGRRRAPGPLRL